VIVNGKHLLDLEREHLLTNSERSAEFKEIREDPYQPITFTSRNTFLGLPQMKTYFDLEIRLMFRTKVSLENTHVSYVDNKTFLSR